MHRTTITSTNLNIWLHRYFQMGFEAFPLNISINEKTGKKNLHPPYRWNHRNFTLEMSLSLIRNQDFNAIAIKTGSRSGLFVLDIDSENGKNGLDTLGVNNIDIPDNTPTVITPGGGLHYYFKFPDNLSGKKSTGSDKISLIDWRGEGGLIIVPPTVIPDYGRYAFTKQLENSTLSNPPAKLIKWILSHSHSGASPGKKANSPYQGKNDLSELSEAQRDVLFRTLKESEEAPVGKRSGPDYSLIKWCIRMDLKKEVIWTLVRNAGKFYERGRWYFETTLRKAYYDLKGFKSSGEAIKDHRCPANV